MEKKAHWLNELVNQSISDEAVYRTAPATPSLLLKDHAKFIDLNEEEEKVTIFPQFKFLVPNCFFPDAQVWATVGGSCRLGPNIGAGEMKGITGAELFKEEYLVKMGDNF